MTDTEKPCVFPSLGRPEGTGCIAYHLAALPMDKAIGCTLKISMASAFTVLCY